MILDDLPTGLPAPTFRLLQGVLVLDLTTSVAGPYATMLLSDFGAEVLKVEKPKLGDDARQWGPPFLDGESLWFLAMNRNKQSVSLDYACAAGRRVLSELLDLADVVITNQVADVQKKLGVDAATVRGTRPQLIHVSLTGFGVTGSKAALACYDIIAEGYSGIMDLTGTADCEPQKVGAPAADMLAGSDAAMTVLAALYRRTATGQGCAIDVSLTESAVRFMSARIVPYLGSGQLPRRSGGRDSVIAIYQSFDTADLPLTLALGNDAIWQRFWSAVGRPELAHSEGWTSNEARRENRAAIVIRIQSLLSARPRAQWLAVFEQARVPAGPIYRIDEVVQDAHFRERALFFQIERAGQRIPQVGLGVHIDGLPSGIFAPPPRLDEHTDSVLGQKLNYDAARLDELRATGVIGYQTNGQQAPRACKGVL